MPKKISAVILLIAMLSACATPERLKIVDTSCTAFSPLNYAQLAPGVVDDPGNLADSDETVRQIDGHNVKWDRLCAGK